MELGFGVLFKKKVSEEKVATLFINNVLNSVDEGFSNVADILNNDLQLETPASIRSDDQDAFLMIVIAGNYSLLDSYFEEGQEDRIRELIIDGLTGIFDTDHEHVQLAIENMLEYFSKVNFPSKKTIYAMSKAVFYKYDLNQYQKPFFKEKNVPDPVLLKHIDEIMDQFLIDWNRFIDKFKITD